MSDAELESPPAQLPPLRIHHLMLWTAVSAVLFTVLKKAAVGEFGAQMFNGGMLPTVLLESLALCGLGLGIFWWRTGLPFFTQPGHAAYVGFSLYALFHVTWTVLLAFSGPFMDYYGSGSWLSWLIMYGWYGLLLAQFGLNLFFAYRFRQPLRWRWFFLLETLAVVLQVVGQFTFNFWVSWYAVAGGDLSWITTVNMLVQILPEVLPIVCLVYVVIKDRTERIAYHWTHWLGVGIWFGTWLAMIGYWLWMILAPPEWSAYPPA